MALTFYKLVLKGNLPSLAETRNMFYVEAEASTINWATDASAYFTNLFTQVKDSLPQTFHYYGCDVSEHMAGGGSNPWTVGVPYTFTITGTDPSDILPFQVAAVVIAKTPTKRVIGRKFLGPICEGGQQNGIIVAQGLTRFQDFATKWAAAYTAPSTTVLTPMIWGQVHGFNAITGTRADSILGTMRRRKMGVGI